MFSVLQALILPAHLSRHNPSTLSLLIHSPSKKNLWNLPMAHPDLNPMWKFPVFLNHAEKTVHLGSFKDICLLRLKTKKNKPNPSLQINSSKLKACGNIYYCVLYFLVWDIWARRDLTDHLNPIPGSRDKNNSIRAEAEPRTEESGFLIEQHSPFPATAGSGKHGMWRQILISSRMTTLKDSWQPVPRRSKGRLSHLPFLREPQYIPRRQNTTHLRKFIYNSFSLGIYEVI